MDAMWGARVADVLLTAYETRQAVEPLTEQHPQMTLDDAYEIQLLQISRRLADGASIKGHKVGLTSAAMQRQFGVDRPDFGHLLDDMFLPEHQPIPSAGFLQPRIEPEIAFVLRRRLCGPGVTAAEAAAAVDFVLPALEVIDSRIRDWKIRLFDTIADNASCGGVILGSTPVPLDDVDLRLTGCVLQRNGHMVDSGVGTAVLGSPLNALIWLANTLGRRGVVLEAGHVILSGSVTAAVPVRPGDAFTATFAGIGSVTAIFSQTETS